MHGSREGALGRESDLRASQEICRRMTARHARTFYFASPLLPPQKRSDAYAVYAFCRYVDDAIDHAPGEAERRAALVELEAILDRTYAPAFAGEQAPPLPWLSAFREVAHRRAIPRRYFADLLIGMAMDQGRVRVRNWAELDLYCYHVAGVVGLIMVHLFTEPRPELLEPARHLGTAMQLTNILRDIEEDWGRDRLYLPQDELLRFGLGEADIAAPGDPLRWRPFLQFQIERARSYYTQAEPGLQALPRDGSRLTARLMGTLYGAILEQIERAGYRVHGRRARVSFTGKLRRAGQLIWQQGWR